MAWQCLKALNNRGQWPGRRCRTVSGVLGVWGLANGRLERPQATEGSGLTAGKRQAWRPLTTEGSGLSAGSKLSRRIFRGFRRLRAGKRQAWRPLTAEGSGLTAGKRQAWRTLTREGSGLSAWSKMPRSIVGGLRRFRAGKRQAWTPCNNRGQWTWPPGRRCRGAF